MTILSTTLSTLKPTAYQFAAVSTLAFALVATGCQSPATKSAVSTAKNNSASMPAPASQQTLEQQALRIQQALANKDYASITNDIHPTRGVRFSMYAYVRPESNKIFSREQYAQYLQQSKIRFTWGEKDGTGDLLIEPLPTYLNTWVNAKKFNNASVSINNLTNNGNSINNLRQIYQYADVVEFYTAGSEEYAGMDWRVLRLVFDEYQGKRYLVAIINDQWTV